MLLSHTAQREGELLTFLRGELALSSGLVKRLKWQNAFFLDGVPVHTNARVKPGQEITVRIEEAPEGFLPQALPIDILYEDAYMIALDKPAGQLVHPSPRKNEGTLANALLGYYERTDQPCGIHPVTRLDRDTFGVVLLAKNAHIHAKLCQLMKDGAIHKTYLASVFGCPEQPAGEIALPVYKLGNGSLLRMVDPRGKRAVSRFVRPSDEHPCPEPRDRQDAPAAPALQGGRLSDSRRPTVLLARVRPLFRHARAVLPAAAGGKAGAYAPRDGAAACDFLAAERFSGRRTGPC